MAIDLRPVPDFARRRALQGHWEQAGSVESVCDHCGEIAPLNVLYVCRACNYKENISSLSIVAAPWALREVRRRYGHNGETNRDSEYRKQQKHEESERLVATSISYGEYQKRIADQLG